MDYILNGSGHGDVATRLLQNQGDPNILRPFIGKDGQAHYTTNVGSYEDPVYKTFVTNSPATLRKDEWILLDQAVIKAAQPRLRIISDFRSSGLDFVVPNGMAKTVLQHQTQSDISPATISMDGLRESQRDRPQYELENLPLPIIHKDFSFSLREILVSQNGSTPLDTTNAELAARKVAEEAEKLALGITSTYQYAGGIIYGLVNYPNRLTLSLTAPTSTNHETTVNEVLGMRKLSIDNDYPGPWVLYHGREWNAFMDQDYIPAQTQNITLRTRLNQIPDITAIRNADFLTGTQLLLVQQTPDVARMVIGMDITTVQWESKGGMELNYKVMAIMVPQLRSDYYGKTGIVHAS